MNKINTANPVWVWSCDACKGTKFANEVDFDLMIYVDICINCGQKYAFSHERGDESAGLRQTD